LPPPKGRNEPKREENANRTLLKPIISGERNFG